MSKRPAAFVTGGRRGIGRAICWALADGGFDIVVNDIVEDEAVGDTLSGIESRGGQAMFLRGDVSDLAGHAALAGAAWKGFDGIDCLVNNAGIQVAVRGDLLDMTAESWDRLLATNLRGPFFLTQRIARLMIATPPRRGQGGRRAIVNIASINSERASTNRGDYCISKAGVSMMTSLFALRLARHGIAVNEIRPGIIRTDMTAPVKDGYDREIAAGLVPIARWGEGEDVGRAVAALASGAFPFTTGEALHVDGGLHIGRL
jgi:NAD(P)-dependent dehydrogenase (short-subunit alcohol dehydrogenase family)